jgi:hypothetical protein
MQAVQRFFSWWSGTFKKQGIVGKVAFGCFSLFMLCCLCSVPIGLLNPSKSTPEVTKTVVVEVSPSPISESAIPTETKAAEVVSTETTVAAVSPTETIIPTIAPSNTPAPTPTEKISAFLPGLKPADVTVNLEQRGFTCSSVEQGQLYYTRVCNKDTADYSLHVEIYGRELFSVDFIDSTVLQYATPDNGFAASFLGFMATMPYDGAVQDESRSWVETTLPTLKGQGDVREKVFAGVTYRLFGIPTAITLEMGNLP